VVLIFEKVQKLASIQNKRRTRKHEGEGNRKISGKPIYSISWSSKIIFFIMF